MLKEEYLKYAQLTWETDLKKTREKVLRITNIDTRNKGGSMRPTILFKAIILTQAQRATVSIMAKGCILTRVLSMR